MRRTGIAVSVTWIIPVLLLLPAVSRAEIIVDPKPPLRWEEMLACELIIVGRHEKHDDATLTLRVERVIKGGTVRVDSLVTVRLEHWYLIQTGRTVYEPAGPDDGIPRLCYKQQVHNPGPPVPVKVVDDVRRAAVYLFPKEDAPTLAARGQVQPALLADGWQQALDLRPINLTFRLLMDVEPRMSRDAIEELGRTRDPRVLERLVAWLLSPPSLVPPHRSNPVPGILAAVGDRGGDVYNPLLQQLKEQAEGTDPYRYFAIARTLAQLDRPRAERDFADLLTRGPEPVRKAVASGLGTLGTEAAMNLAFDLLRKPPLDETAIFALQEILIRTGQPPPTHLTAPEWSALREKARPKLRAALAAPDVDEARKNYLRGGFYELLREEKPLDLAAAEKALLDPNDPLYRNEWSNQGATAALQEIHRASDPRAVPLLVKVLKDVPAACKVGSFRSAFEHYAFVCRNAMRREMEARGMLMAADPAQEVEICEWMKRVRLALDVPGGLGQAWEAFSGPGGKAWLARHPELHAATVQAACAEEDRRLGWDDWRPGIADLLLLAELTPERCAAYVDRYVAKGIDPAAYDRTAFLGVAVRVGRTALLDDLIASVREGMKKKPPDSPDINGPLQLLRCGHPRAFEEFMATLNTRYRTHRSPFENRENPDDIYLLWMDALFPGHAADYFDHVLALLESPSAAERRGGERSLHNTCRTTFGYAPEALAPERAKKMETLRPLLKRLAGMNETEMRAAILRESGVRLDGSPGKSRLRSLLQAAANPDAGVAQNALALIDAVAGDTGCAGLHTLPPEARAHALTAYAHDRGIDAGMADPSLSPSPPR